MRWSLVADTRHDPRPTCDHANRASGLTESPSSTAIEFAFAGFGATMVGTSEEEARDGCSTSTVRASGVLLHRPAGQPVREVLQRPLQGCARDYRAPLRVQSPWMQMMESLITNP
jgi:hypothetical protein